MPCAARRAANRGDGQAEACLPRPPRESAIRVPSGSRTLPHAEALCRMGNLRLCHRDAISRVGTPLQSQRPLSASTWDHGRRPRGCGRWCPTGTTRACCSRSSRDGRRCEGVGAGPGDSSARWLRVHREAYCEKPAFNGGVLLPPGGGTQKGRGDLTLRPASYTHEPLREHVVEVRA